MKNRILMRIWAILLVACLAVSSISTVQILKVYATEEDSDTDDDDDDDDDDDPSDPGDQGGGDSGDPSDPSQGGGIVDPVLPPDPAPQPDPPAPEPTGDYDIACYTPNISFGTVNVGDVVIAKNFNVVNTGSVAFPLAWDEVDPYTAFALNVNYPDNDLAPGDSLTFSICPEPDLTAGDYSAKYVFYNGNDPTRAHSATVNVSVSVNGNPARVNRVDINPGAVTVPAGSSYQFSAAVSGSGSYDPTVIWSISGNGSTSTSIDQNGNLSVASNESASSFRVFATSRQDTDIGDSATVTVTTVGYVITVNADPSNGGAVAGGGSVRAGDSVDISASANNNYTFKGWYEGGNLVSSNNRTTISNIQSNRTFTAKFDRSTCYVKTSVNDSDAGKVTDSASVPYGGNMTITAKAKDGYHFEKFVEDGKTITESNSLQLNNITSDRNITAVFSKNTVKVNVAANPAQTGAIDGGGKYDIGSNVNLQAYATDGYVFVGWTINGQLVSKDTRYTINNVRNDMTVIANFMQKGAQTFSITSAIANQGGTITPSGDIIVPQGGSATFTILPQPGYVISAVMIDGKNIGPVSTYTFNNVQGIHAIAAGFSKKAAAPAATSGTGTTVNNNQATVKVVDNKETPKKTEYNQNTAAEGAVPEQKIIYSDIPEEMSELDPNAYAGDVYTISMDGDNDAPASTSGSVMVKHNLTEDQLRSMIEGGDVLPLLREAYEDGTLKITVNNSFAADKQETAVQLYYSNPTLSNFEDVIAETLTNDEKFKVLTGSEISFNIDISDSNDTISTNDKKALQSKIGYKPLSFFDFVILKTSDGVTSVIDKTSADLEVTLPIPDKFRKSNRKFVVLRDHNGTVDVLKDIGEDEASITFRTDRFSEYALGYEAVSTSGLILRFVLISLGGLILALLCFINLLKHKRKHDMLARREAAAKHKA